MTSSTLHATRIVLSGPPAFGSDVSSALVEAGFHLVEWPELPDEPGTAFIVIEPSSSESTIEIVDVTAKIAKRFDWRNCWVFAAAQERNYA
ncbi:MAG: hypothetical protein ACRDK7_02740 [Solirubrobacteraceae bacterium]